MKKLIIIGILFVLGIITWYIIADQLQYRSINFDLKGSNYIVEVYQQDAKTSTFKVSRTSVQRLKAGNYYYKAIGDKLSDKKIEFTVASTDKQISVDPDYSTDYLASLATEAQGDVYSIVKNKYSSVINDYTFSTFRLSKKGDWGGGYLIQTVNPEQAPDIYRYVVHKQNNTWVLVTAPELSISANKYPEIPIEVLEAVDSAISL